MLLSRDYIAKQHHKRFIVSRNGLRNYQYLVPADHQSAGNLSLVINFETYI